MAENTYNITLPDGTTVPIPAWARESTLRVLVDQLKIGLDLNNNLIKEVMNLNVDTNDIEDAIKKMFDGLEKVKREETAAEEVSRAEFAKTIAKRTNDIVDSFSNTEAPLTSMTKNLETFSGFLGKSAGSLFGDSKMLSKISPQMQAKLGTFANALGDGLFGYMGFMAGQVEQFAKAQANMINAGAIFYESGDTFDSLRASANKAGITYNELSKIAVEYGTTLQVLGNGVSGGVHGFLTQLHKLDEISDSYGDFGLSAEQLAHSFAEYIDVARLTGKANRETINKSDKLQTGYAELMMETTALAALTGKSRDQLLAEQNAALRTPETAAALTRLRAAGFEDEASKIEDIIRQVDTVKSYLPDGVSNILQTAISTAYTDALARDGHIENVDINAALTAATQNTPEIRQLLTGSGITIVSDIQKSIGDPEVTNADIRDFMINQVSEFADKMPNLQVNTGDMSAWAAMLKDFKDRSVILQRDFNTLQSMSETEREQYVTEMQKRLDGAGTATVAINELTVLFLQAQDALTLPLNESAELLRGVAGGLKSLAGIFDDKSGFDTPSPVALTEQNIQDAESRFQEEGGSLDNLDPSDAPSQGVNGLRPTPITYDEERLKRYRTRFGDNNVVKQFDVVLDQNVYIITNPAMPTLPMMMPEPKKDGGPVSSASRAGYIVGEAGPEYFEPGQSGAVTSYQKLNELMQQRLVTLEKSANEYEHLIATTANIPKFDQGLSSITIEDMRQLIDEFVGNTSGSNFEVNLNKLSGTNNQQDRDIMSADMLNINRRSTVVADNKRATALTSRNEPFDAGSQNHTQEVRDKLAVGMSEIANIKNEYAGIMRQLTQEFIKYRKLNETNRTIG